MPPEGHSKVPTPADPVVLLGFLLLTGSLGLLLCLGVVPIFYSLPSVVNLVVVGAGALSIPILTVGFIWEGKTIKKRNEEMEAKKEAEKKAAAAAAAAAPTPPVAPPEPPEPEPAPEQRPLVRVSEKYLKRIGF